MRNIPRNSFVLEVLCFSFCISSIAQKDSATSFKIGGYADVYYAGYSDSLGPGKLQKFPAISPRSNSFGVNVAQATMQYNSYRLRSTITLQAGDLPSAAWSPVYNFIQEANVGVRLSKTLWLDGGFFKTHIGTESLLPKDNIASSVSMITFFEPWWQAGGRLTYTPNERFQIALYVVDGYNEFVAANRKKAIGLAISYALGLKGSISYNNFISDNTPDNYPVAHSRFLNNLVFNYEFSKKFKIQAGFDFISQQHSVLSDTNKTAYIYSYILTARYQFAKSWGIYSRGERYNDPQGFLSGVVVNTTGKLTGYMMNGLTLGLEYKATDNSYIRFEGRELYMASGEDLFYTDGKYVNKRGEVMVTMGIWF